MQFDLFLSIFTREHVVQGQNLVQETMLVQTKPYNLGFISSMLSSILPHYFLSEIASTCKTGSSHIHIRAKGHHLQIYYLAEKKPLIHHRRTLV